NAFKCRATAPQRPPMRRFPLAQLINKNIVRSLSQFATHAIVECPAYTLAISVITVSYGLKSEQMEKKPRENFRSLRKTMFLCAHFKKQKRRLKSNGTSDAKVCCQRRGENHCLTTIAKHISRRRRCN